MSNYICIGDIHGRYDLLSLLLKKIERRKGDILVFMGDMVDRGRDSFLVVDKVKKLCEEEGAIALLGNHEDMMLDFHRGKIVDRGHIWLMNGGMKTIRSYEENMRMYGVAHFFNAFEKSGHAEWMRKLPFYYETDEVWFSHAPVPSDSYFRRMPYIRPVEGDIRAQKEMLIWAFAGNVAMEGEWERKHGKLAVCGHIHRLFDGVRDVRVYPHIIYSDSGSGCSEDAPLSAVMINDGQFAGKIQAWPEEVS